MQTEVVKGRGKTVVLRTDANKSHKRSANVAALLNEALRSQIDAIQASLITVSTI